MDAARGRDRGPHFKGDQSSSEEQVGPAAHVVWEALLSEDLCCAFWVDVVEEAGDVEEE